MLNVRTRIIALLLAAGLLACAASARADLAITIPPGMAIEEGLRRRATWPTLDVAPPGGSLEPKSNEDGSVAGVARFTPRPWQDEIALGPDYSLQSDAFTLADINTPDAPKHVLWMDRSPTSGPAMSQGLRMLVFSYYLRVHLHGPLFVNNGVVVEEEAEQVPPSQPEQEDFVQFLMTVHVPDIINRLIEIGEPALFVAGDERIEGKHLKRVAAAVRDCVGPASGPLPPAAKGATKSETRFNRLLRDLGTLYYYEYAPGFGARVAAEGGAILPALMQAAESHPHALVRRNATAVLGEFGDSDDIRACLRRIAQGEDLVSATRALLALARRGDRALTPWLCERVLDRDPWRKNPAFPHLAAYCLGLTGGAGTEQALIEWANRAIADSEAGGMLVNRVTEREVLWTAVAALARRSAQSPEALALFTKAANREKDSAGPLSDLCMIAQFAANVGEAKERCQRLFAKNKYPLAEFHPACHYLLIDVLRALPNASGREYLWRIVNSMDAPLPVRQEAFTRWIPLKNDGDLLKKMIQLRATPPVLRAIALGHLATVDAKKAESTATVFLKRYADEYRSAMPGAGFDLLSALRFVYASGGLNTEALIELAEFGRLLYATQAPPPEDAEHAVLTIPPPVAGAAMLAIARLHEDAGRAYLLGALDDATHRDRETAARALGLCADKETIPKLIERLANEQQPWVRRALADALARLTSAGDDCDWVYGDADELARGVAYWQAWLNAQD